ncbi:Aldo/keto reductase [Auriscalpium vulgare]|uniref:Aldo/keto reductase n=1 Tax=Auriscalpium vulgare TaxID=40419 RepID=A0ACB8RIP7_9AGAM|nr:Aldo/keto reductase [Auriscalpium vulgare]
MGLWKIPNADCPDVVYNAIKAGVRLFDSAADYGNEKEAAEGVKRALKEGIVTREELCSLYVRSQLWNTFHRYEDVKAAAKLQLEHWGLDYFDLYLIHFPIALDYVDPAHKYPPGWYGDDGKIHPQNTPLQETWRAIEELVDAGLAKNIGISNVAGGLLLDILRYARIQPQVVQVELHPYLNQSALINLTKVLGIALTAYSSFGPQGYFEMGVSGPQTLLQQPKILKIAAGHGRKRTVHAHKRRIVAPGQVILRWSTQRGIAVIPKTTDVKLTKENLDCNTFDLTQAEIDEIAALNVGLRMNDPKDLDPRLGIFA